MTSLQGPTDDEVLEARKVFRALESAFQLKFTHVTPLGSGDINPMPIEIIGEFEKERNEVETAKRRYEDLKKRQSDN